MPSPKYWLAALPALLFAAPAFADQAQSAPSATSPDRPDRLIMVGIGPRVAPTYPGSTSAEFGVFPVINSWSEDQLFPVESKDEGKSITLAGSRNEFAAGIAFAIAPTRGRETATEGLRKVGFGMELGGFVEGYVMPELRLRGELRRGIGGHNALSGDVAADYVLRSKDNDRAMLTIGPRARFGSAKYNRRFFGIDASESAASGLAPYRPKAGLNTLGVMAGAYYPLGDKWGLFGFAGYDRLMSKAADSPLTRERGSRDQLSTGLALTYVFRIKR